VSLDGRIIAVDYKKSDNIHRFEQSHPAGDYKFCFDNTISSFNRKTVFFELMTEDPDNPTSDGDNAISELEGLTPEEFYDMKVQDILDIIHIVRGHITKARQLQDMLRSFEARDRNLAELNNSRVNMFSTIIVLTMIGVGILQVFMIRNLFETNPKGRKVWEKIGHFIGQ
jgi:p24 family protein gamma-2